MARNSDVTVLLMVQINVLDQVYLLPMYKWTSHTLLEQCIFANCYFGAIKVVVIIYYHGFASVECVLRSKIFEGHNFVTATLQTVPDEPDNCITPAAGGICKVVTKPATDTCHADHPK